MKLIAIHIHFAIFYKLEIISWEWKNTHPIHAIEALMRDATAPESEEQTNISCKTLPQQLFTEVTEPRFNLIALNVCSMS